MKKGIFLLILTICLVLMISTSAMAIWINPFNDVDEEDWFYPAVRYVNDEGLMLGTAPTIFAPLNSVTRGQTVTILWRHDEQPTPAGVSSFTELNSRLVSGCC